MAHDHNPIARLSRPCGAPNPVGLPVAQRL